MPYAAPSPCRHPGCPNKTMNGYCKEHRRTKTADYDAKRGNSNARGYGWRWRKYSQQFLMARPICAIADCGHPSEHTDHIEPVTGPDDPNFWEVHNHQQLCHSCHSNKTRGEDHVTRGGVKKSNFYNPATPCEF